MKYLLTMAVCGYFLVGCQINERDKVSCETTGYFLLDDKGSPLMDRRMLSIAEIEEMDKSKRYEQTEIAFLVSKEVGEKVWRFSRAHTLEKLALISEGKVIYSAPIQSPFGRRFKVSFPNEQGEHVYNKLQKLHKQCTHD